MRNTDAHLTPCPGCGSSPLASEQDTGTFQLDASVHSVGSTGPRIQCPDSPPELAGHPRYELLGLIGAGGMGCVYKARHRFMDRLVALKVITPRLLDQPAMVERFLREVQAAARLDHPNIVRAYDADEAGGLHFLVMEYVDGVNLDQVLIERERLPIAVACNYARQAALGLQHAHERGMIHRDIKPHNLMLTGGVVKILDFGLARYVSEAIVASCAAADTAAAEAASHGLSGRTSIPSYGGAGTPDYMAPEVLDARRPDIRADIYSLGCTLYRFLTGRVPFPVANPLMKAKFHLEQEPDALAHLRPDAPAELIRAVERMMAKDPAHRPQTPAEAARALAPFARAALPRVLIVEDEPAERHALALALEGEGYAVAVAANGKEALEQLRGQPLPDLIMLDLMMPVMDGWRLLYVLKADPRLADVPVIVLSGTEPGRDKMATVDADDYLKKPLPIEELAAKLRRHVRPELASR